MSYLDLFENGQAGASGTGSNEGGCPRLDDVGCAVTGARPASTRTGAHGPGSPAARPATGTHPDPGTHLDPGTSAAIFAATDMTVIAVPEAPGSGSVSAPARDLIVRNGIRYRRLTPEYWAWFHHKYRVMERAVATSRISEDTFRAVLDRMCALYNHSVARYGRDAVVAAQRAADVRAFDAMIRRESAPPSLVAERPPSRTTE